MKRKQIPSLLAAALLFASPRPAIGAPSPFPTLEQRRELFRAAVADVRKYHIFSDVTVKLLGRTWEQELPGLAREIDEATDDDQLATALQHFANSLHNGHCYFSAPMRSPQLGLGIVAAVDWHGDKPSFYVSRVEAPAIRELVRPGDEIRSVDGIPANELLARLANVSNQSQWRGIATDVARYLGSRSQSSPAREGATTTWVIARRGTRQEVKLDLPWRKQERSQATDDPLRSSYDSASCSTLADRGYGPYAITARGKNFCLYTSTAPVFKEHPILRHFSFLYEDSFQEEHAPHQLRADHDLLVRELGQGSLKGLLVDLRDNHGGNSPNWIMDWYASKPYPGFYVLVPLSDELDTKEKIAAAHIGTADEYLKQLAARVPGQKFWKRPFGCRTGTCVPAHPITTAPIALLVGPGCASSCDAVARLFAENRFGPVLGEPTASAFTSVRLERDIVLPGGRPFGFFTLAFSYDMSGKTGLPLEGVPLPLDALIESTFDIRDSYDRLLVDTAIKLLHGRHP